MALLLPLSACSSSTGGPSGQQEAAVDAFELISRRGAAAAGVRYFGNVDELLANQPFTIGDRPTAPLTDAVVVGRVNEVVDGRAFSAEGSEEVTVEVPWNDESALWRTFHVVVETQEVISGSAGGRVTLGIALGASATHAQVEQSFEDGRQLLLFLRSDSEVFAYDPSVFADVENGMFIATVTDGEISFPALDPETERSVLGASRTVGALKVQASAPEAAPIIVDAAGRREKVSGGT
jgi:hypothetical protein